MLLRIEIHYLKYAVAVLLLQNLQMINALLPVPDTFIIILRKIKLQRLISDNSQN